MFEGLTRETMIALAFAALVWTVIANGLPRQGLVNWCVAAFVGVCGGTIVHWITEDTAGGYARVYGVVAFLVVTGAVGMIATNRDWNRAKEIPPL